VYLNEAKTSHSHIREMRFPPPLHTSQIRYWWLPLLCRDDNAGVCDSSNLRACSDTSVT